MTVTSPFLKRGSHPLSLFFVSVKLELAKWTSEHAPGGEPCFGIVKCFFTRLVIFHPTNHWVKPPPTLETGYKKPFCPREKWSDIRFVLMCDNSYKPLYLFGSWKTLSCGWIFLISGFLISGSHCSFKFLLHSPYYRGYRILWLSACDTFVCMFHQFPTVCFELAQIWDHIYNIIVY